jgi:RNase P subunit RPR2
MSIRTVNVICHECDKEFNSGTKINDTAIKSGVKVPVIVRCHACNAICEFSMDEGLIIPIGMIRNNKSSSLREESPLVLRSHPPEKK